MQAGIRARERYKKQSDRFVQMRRCVIKPLVGMTFAGRIRSRRFFIPHTTTSHQNAIASSKILVLRRALAVSETAQYDDGAARRDHRERIHAE